MTGVIHQPHFLPWLGYFNKLSNADIFIIQDNVQYRERYFQNRTLIVNKNSNELSWLTIPVKHSRDSMIKDVFAANSNWGIKLANTIYHNYKQSKYFDFYYPELNDIILTSESDLVSINENLIRFILSKLDVNIQIKRASEFEKQKNATQDLIFLCKQNHIDKYIFGEGGGIKYHGLNYFKSNSISTFQQRYAKRLNFPEFHISNKHICNLSIMEYLFYKEIDWLKDRIVVNTLRKTRSK